MVARTFEGCLFVFLLIAGTNIIVVTTQMVVRPLIFMNSGLKGFYVNIKRRVVFTKNRNDCVPAFNSTDRSVSGQ